MARIYSLRESPVYYVIDGDETDRCRLAELCHPQRDAVYSFACAEDFLGAWEADPTPGIVVVNESLPGMRGLELQTSLNSADVPTVLIFIGEGPELETVITAVKQGAVSYLRKPVCEESWLETVAEAREQLREKLDRHEFGQTRQESFEKLTPREREVFELVSRGLMNKQIAILLGIAEKTVKIHRGRVMHKLQLSTIAQLVQFSLQLRPERLYETLITLDEDWPDQPERVAACRCQQELVTGEQAE